MAAEQHERQSSPIRGYFITIIHGGDNLKSITQVTLCTNFWLIPSGILLLWSATLEPSGHQTSFYQAQPTQDWEDSNSLVTAITIQQVINTVILSL